MKHADTRVLIVPNGSGTQKKLELLLSEASSCSFAVKCAKSESEVEDALSRSKFDICLHSGALEQLCHLAGEFPKTPFIAIVDSEEPNAGIFALQAGAVDYVNKDTVSESLLAHVLQSSIQRFREGHESRHDELSYSTFIQFSPDGIWCLESEPIPVDVDEDKMIRRIFETTRIIECNDTFAKMEGKNNRGELLGVWLREILPPSDETNVEYVRNFIRNRFRLVGYENTITDSDGNPHYFVDTLIGIVENGCVYRAWGTSRDITKFRLAHDASQAALEREKAERRMLEATLDAVCLTAEQKTKDDVCLHAVETIRDKLGFDRAGIWMLDDETGKFRGTHGTDQKGNTVDEHDVVLKGPQSELARELLDASKQYILIENFPKKIKDLGGTIEKVMEGTGQVGYVPIRKQGHAIGFVSVDNLLSGAVFGEQDLTRLALFAENVANVIDVIEQRISRERAEIGLRESEERYRSLVEYAPEAIVVVDVETGLFVDANANAEALFGLSREELFKVGPADMSPPEQPCGNPSSELASARIRQAADGQTPVFEWVHRDSKGNDIQCEVMLVRLPAAGKSLVRASVTDITVRKQFEEALQRRDTILDAVNFVAEHFLKTSSWEESINVVLGRLGAASGASRVHIYKYHTDDSGDLLASQLYEWVAQGITPQIDNINMQCFSLKKNGFERRLTEMLKGEIISGQVRDFPPEEQEVLSAQDILSIVCVPIFVGGELWGTIGVDECERSREWSPAEIGALSAAAKTLQAAIEREHTQLVLAEQRLKMISSSRLSSLGVMASGVAHEINNPLAVISGGAEQIQELVRDITPKNEQMIRVTDTIMRNVGRVERIVRGLRHLSRGGARAPFRVTVLKELIAETVELCAARFKAHGIRLDIAEIPEQLKIECQITQLSQVLLNLLNNAHDAVEDLPHKWVKFDVDDVGDFVEICVTDSGIHPSNEVSDRIFEPFYTSKEIGKGTGLGLSISKGIIDGHNGELFLDMNVKNTRFVIRLPKHHSDNGDCTQ